MKKTFLLLFFLLLILRGYTTAQNPYESLGKVAPVLTLSEGKYQEFMTNDTIVQIGSVLFNTITKEVVAFQDDTLGRMDADMTTRFLSVDPIGRKFPELTPYQFASNTPIQAIDLDGLEEFYYLNAQKNKFIGFVLILKILTETGIMGEIKACFEENNTKTDMYYNVERISAGGHTEVYAGSSSTSKERRREVQNETYQAILSENPSLTTNELLFMWETTITANKGVVMLQLNEEVIKAAGKNLQSLEDAALTAAHEPRAHGLNSKGGVNLHTDLEEHSEFNGKAAQMAADPTGVKSVPHKNIDPKSVAGEYKARIKKYIKEHKAELEKMIQEANKDKPKEEKRKKKK